MKKNILLVFVILFYLSCSKKDNKSINIEKAFYHWKGESYFDETSINELNNHKIKKIYFKMFEVDYNDVKGNYPYEKNSPSTYTFEKLDSINIIPVVFIRNEIFQFNSEKTLDKLADNITFLIEKYQKNNGNPFYNYSEIQIDCDWTKSTKNKYFYLLKKIKELSKKEISCTLRLYPYKYPDVMGIPPVDKVTLMCYNLIKPLSNKEKNSILDIEELKSYLNVKKKYPLHLDIALPVYYWTQWYQNNRFSGLLNISSSEFKTFAKEIKPLWFEITKDTTYNYDTYFRKGDQLKCEEVSKDKILEAITIIKNNIELDEKITVSLFHLDQSTFKKYDYESISSFYNSFSK
ncbi:hypothetical protein [Flavobacterium faecale]|uniref:hypothetical protein n=1 Tax=Flavobacterium faecale TaxID=1355330 RepID=UPI003AABD6ED